MTPWSAEIESFLQHWRNVRAAELVPASERFLDHAPLAFMARCYIVEVRGDVAFVRFQGSVLADFWQGDFTRRDIHEGSREKYKARSFKNMNNVIGLPCGHYLRLLFNTSLGTKLSSEYLTLPLGVNPGRAPRLVCFVKPEIQNERIEPMTRTIEAQEPRWIDIGAGVPAEPPLGYL